MAATSAFFRVTGFGQTGIGHGVGFVRPAVKWWRRTLIAGVGFKSASPGERTLKLSAVYGRRFQDVGAGN
ncbi:hypothetical protein KCP75_17905 [Salmonella enterica subsp. enterica]|nr:hypothetical protein KCP75_17905 [Salmonella enterica subsp. enterica]